MSITINEHVFDGPYTTTKDLMDDPGVFAVIIAKEEKGTLIDVGESNNIRKGIESHKNRVKWDRFTSAGTLCFAALYTPDFNQTERASIEQDIRAQYEKNDSNDSEGSNYKRKDSE
ncbi:MAG: hypothetical protein U9N54_06965 [candidate division Zixibacteria bacterium]|nr:hypothetical protein [candidate division Zixibacteria bacterium]